MILISIISISAVSAADLNDTDVIGVEQADELSVGGGAPTDDDLGENNLVSENDVLTSDEEPSEYVIYIGQNTTEGGGNGSYENPYNDLYTGFNNVSKIGNATNIVNITVYIFNGTYALNNKAIYLNRYANFVIRAMDDANVTIFGSKTFSVSNYGDCTLSTEFYGINFNCQLAITNRGYVGMENCVINSTKNLAVSMVSAKTIVNPIRNFINCTFIGLPQITSTGKGSMTQRNPYPAFINFTNCNFIDVQVVSLYDSFILIKDCSFTNILAIGGGERLNSDYQFTVNNCKFSSDSVITLGISNPIRANYSYENNWWGANDLDDVIEVNGNYPVEAPSTYAVFNADMNYLNGNDWEIIGKLTWNDGTSEGIECFDPMTVSLTSSAGTFNDSNPVLKNGEFKVIFTGDVEDNEITATLDKEVQTLSFINVGVDVDNVDYGNFANVTVTVPSNINGNITVTVNNKTYSVKTTETAVSFIIDEILNPGNYTVDVVFIDEENGLYGVNSTSFIVNKVEVSDDALDLSNIEGRTPSVSIELPKDATGNLTVTIGDDVFSKELVNGTACVEITGLIANDYDATVVYSGDDIYDSLTKDINVVIPKMDTKITIVGLSDGFNLTGVLKDADGNVIANATIFYTIAGGDRLNTTTGEDGTFNVWAEDNSEIKFFFDGDDDSNPSNAAITLKNIKPTPKTTIIDVPTTMTKTAVDFNAGEKGTMFYFYLKDGDGKAVANKAVKIGIFDKIYTVKTDKNGRGGLQINIANANYYTYGISFLGDDDYKASFAVCSLQIVKKSVTITPAKTSYSFKTSAKTKTVTATLKSTNSYIPKGKQVTLTIAGKTFKTTIGAKGQISFNIGSVTAKGTYKVAIKFAGTNTYAAATSKTITIKIA